MASSTLGRWLLGDELGRVRMWGWVYFQGPGIDRGMLDKGRTRLGEHRQGFSRMGIIALKAIVGEAGEDA